MKKFTLMMIAMLVSVVSMAGTPKKNFAPSNAVKSMLKPGFLQKKEAREKVGDDRADAFKKMIDLMWEDVALIPLFDWNYSLPCRENIEVTDGLNYAVYFFKVVK